MSYSRWLKTDLHIHSEKSNTTKKNDYDGVELTVDRLMSALEKESVNLFSITDHNTINVDLYNKLIETRDDLVKKNMNFVVGVEIDFLDHEIQDDVFHMLVFFDTYDLDVVSQVLVSIFNKKTIDEIDKDVKPIKLRDFFKAVFDTGISEIITIPHFNNKHKGIPSNDQMDKLAYTVFSALEDSNNRENLARSLKVYKKYNYVDVPFVVFTDNHNIDVYPCGKNGNVSTQTSMSILGNISYPFSSIKTSFQDVSTRISIESINTRKDVNNNKFIKYLEIDGKRLEFSKYQNTIIGGFGSGKSFLLDLILNGKNGVNQEKYRMLAGNYNQVHIKFSDDTSRNSLEEVSSLVKIVRFDQYKDIYFKSVLLESDKDILERNLHIQFPSLSKIPKEDVSKIKRDVESLKKNFDESKNITDTMNYIAINQKEYRLFSFHIEELTDFYTEPDYLAQMVENLLSESSRKVLKRDIYSSQDKETLEDTRNIVTTKNNQYIEFSGKLTRITNSLDNRIQEFNHISEASNQSISSNIKILNNIKNDLITFIQLISKLKNSTHFFESIFSQTKFNELKSRIVENSIYTYKLTAKYFVKNEYPDIQTLIFKPANRKKDMFQSILYTLRGDGSFAQSQGFSDRVNKYVEDYYSNFQEITYDIIDKEISIVKKSAGEKANTIISMIFMLIEGYAKNNTHCVVILDQPEDHLDNKGIHNTIVERIRAMKLRNTLPQMICVSHNANISITADSENIILANKIDGICTYYASGIEDSEFIKKVCNTLEGGTDALKKRSYKFNLPIIKEIEREL